MPRVTNTKNIKKTNIKEGGMPNPLTAVFGTQKGPKTRELDKSQRAYDIQLVNNYVDKNQGMNLKVTDKNFDAILKAAKEEKSILTRGISEWGNKKKFDVQRQSKKVKGTLDRLQNKLKSGTKAILNPLGRMRDNECTRVVKCVQDNFDLMTKKQASFIKEKMASRVKKIRDKNAINKAIANRNKNGRSFNTLSADPIENRSSLTRIQEGGKR